MARTTMDRRDNGGYRARYPGSDAKWRPRAFDRKVDAQRWLANELVKLDRSEWVSSCRKRGLLPPTQKTRPRGTQ